MISRSIESVIAQTYTDWELIIVDDGSTDDTKELIASYISNDTRIKYIHQENAERSAARNNGIKHAKGTYICFLDSDDYYLETRLSGLYENIEKSETRDALFFTDVCYETSSGINIMKQAYYKLFTVDLKDVKNTLVKVIIGVPQVCVQLDVMTKNYFNEQFNIGEDFECWLRISENYPIIYVPNQSTFVANDHADRSVNLKSNNSPKEQRKTLRYCFHKNHPGSKISPILRRKLLAGTYFNSAKHYMFNQNKRSAILFILKSLLTDFSSKQNKHQLFCLKKLIFGEIPDEYK